MDGPSPAAAWVELRTGVAEAIQDTLAEQGWTGSLRIDIQTSGCCDPALGLRAERRTNEDDLTQAVDGIEFVISRRTHDLVGRVSIAVALEGEQAGFVLTSQKPLSEWQGFGVCQIVF